MKKLARVAALIFTALTPVLAHAQEDLYVGGYNTIGQYNETTGATINSTFITTPYSNDILTSVGNNTLLTLNQGTGSALGYNVTTGAYTPFNTGSVSQYMSGAAFNNNILYVSTESGAITGYNTVTSTYPYGISLAASPSSYGASPATNLVLGGSSIYFGLQISSTQSVVEYFNTSTLTPGLEANATVLTGTITGVVSSVATVGNNLYAAVGGKNEILEFNITTGALEDTIAAANPSKLVANSTNLYSLNTSTGAVSEFTDDGAIIYSDLVTVSGADSLLLASPELSGDAPPAAAPEPSTWAMVGLGLLAIGLWRSRAARKA